MGRPDIYTAELLRICSDPAGKLAPEVGILSGAARTTVLEKLAKLTAAGQLHRVGRRKHYRYFTHQAHATAWLATQEQQAATKAKAPPGRRDIYGDKIRALCAVPCGRTLAEIHEHTGAAFGTLGNKLPIMISAGQLVRVGKPRHYRYFTHARHATAWEKGDRPAATIPSPKAGKAPAGRAKPAHGPAMTLTRKSGPESIATATETTWPANVRVHVAPTPRDTRFTFDPPPGWRGEFGREWDQKRKNAHG